MNIESSHSALERARAKLAVPVQPDRTLAAVAAAAVFAISALTFAAAAILAPPLVIVPMSVR